MRKQDRLINNLFSLLLLLLGIVHSAFAQERDTVYIQGDSLKEIIIVANPINKIFPSTGTEVIYPDPTIGDAKWSLLLNEGNMGNYMATLDYFNY